MVSPCPAVGYLHMPKSLRVGDEASHALQGGPVQGWLPPSLAGRGPPPAAEFAFGVKHVAGQSSSSIQRQPTLVVPSTRTPMSNVAFVAGVQDVRTEFVFVA